MNEGRNVDTREEWMRDKRTGKIVKKEKVTQLEKKSAFIFVPQCRVKSDASGMSGQAIFLLHDSR